MRDAANAADLRLSGHGLDPLRPPRRMLDLPRYAAMEEFFDRRGPWGRVMMCNTASVQVCLDAGDEHAGPAGYRSRWRLLHAIGPVLVAAFANSPLRRRRAVGLAVHPAGGLVPAGPGRTRAAAPLPPGRWHRRRSRGIRGTPGPPTRSTRELMCIRRDGQPAGPRRRG